MLDMITSDVQGHIGGADQFDDLTAVVAPDGLTVSGFDHLECKDGNVVRLGRQARVVCY